MMKRVKTVIFALCLLLTAWVAGGKRIWAITPPPPIDSQKGLAAFVTSLGPNLYARLSVHLAESNPRQSHEMLSLLQKEMGQELFVQTVLTMCEHEKVLKAFLDASAQETSILGFVSIIQELMKTPEVIKAITLDSVTNQSDDDIILITRRATMHTDSLKLFASILDDRILAEFAKRTFEDQKTLTLVIQGIQKNMDQAETFATGVDLRKISRKIVEQLDKTYFRDLLAPRDADQELLIHSLSLIDGIIDLNGEEMIDLKVLDRQALKMLDPAFVLTFLWNIYFGDRTSMIALQFRDTMSRADRADGKEDGVVSLRSLVAKDPKVFQMLHEGFAQMLEVSRFQKKFTDPEIILGPTIAFLKKYDAKTVAETLAPLFIRSIDIQPKLAKITIQELPSQVIGTLLDHILTFLGSSAEGKKALRQMTFQLWSDIQPEDLKLFLQRVLVESPQALYNMVIPVIGDLSPRGLASVTRTFARYPDIFFRFNILALSNLTDQAMIAIIKATAKNEMEYFRLSLEVVGRNPRQAQDTFLLRLDQNQAFLTLTQGLLLAMDRQLVQEIAHSISANPSASKSIQQHLPPAIVAQVQKIYTERLMLR